MLSLWEYQEEVHISFFWAQLSFEMATTRALHINVHFEIHDDEAEIDESVPEEDFVMEDDDGEDEEHDLEQDGYSETSDERDGKIDIDVQQDMDKLQETFK